MECNSEVENSLALTVQTQVLWMSLLSYEEVGTSLPNFYPTSDL